MYIKFSVARNIFKLTSHRPPRPVFIQLWYVMLTAKVLLLGQKQAAVKLGPAAALSTSGWALPQHVRACTCNPACKERTA